MTSNPCPFCSPDPPRVFFHGELVFALWDGFPVSDGHALIIPFRHVGGWLDATEEERAGLFEAVSVVIEEIEGTRSPDGYNIGLNVGFAAGPTVDHLHLHVIPRYDGDVPDPRGGIRWVIPERAPYWGDE
ncbi:HIT family protein [Gemmatimonadota bacterium]